MNQRPTAASSPSSASTRPAGMARAFTCRCGRPVFFRNSVCLACQTPLGFDPASLRLLPLAPVAEDPTEWREVTAAGEQIGPAFHRCAHLDSAASCNWLVDPADALTPTLAGPQALCRCCRLTRTLPDLTLVQNLEPWRLIETAKRRLVSSLLGLGLPVRAKVGEDPDHGLAFDLLRADPALPKVTTGHDDGVITLDIAEADDAVREQRRSRLREPYRTLLGHLRHECGHYYWQYLVEPTDWLEPCRAVFGDERQDYAQALKRHYEQGAPAEWADHFVSAYASSHPWEDWAETWAHYLHMVDTLDTATSFGLDGERVDLTYERFTLADLASGDATRPSTQAEDFLRLMQGWMELTGVLNELSRSMGLADFYPFVLARPAVRKLLFVHQVVSRAARMAPAKPPLPARATPPATGTNTAAPAPAPVAPQGA
ncbi:MAG: putative zinc-binding metallopeptidase [Burkholderiales bacterium]